MRGFAILTALLVGRTAGSVSQFRQSSAPVPREEGKGLLKVTWRISDRAGLKTDLPSGQAPPSPDSSTSLTSPHKGGPDRDRQGLAQRPSVLLFPSCLPAACREVSSSPPRDKGYF